MLTYVDPTHCDDLPESYQKLMNEYRLVDSDDCLSIMVGSDRGKHYSMVSASNNTMFVLITLNESTHNIEIRTNEESNEAFIIPHVFYPYKILEDGATTVNENDEGRIYLSNVLYKLISDPNNLNQNNAIQTFNEFMEDIRFCV